jgi:translation elongation factor EF-Ts
LILVFVLQDTNQQLSELASQLSMHTAGMNTQHVSAGNIGQDVLASVRQDFQSQTEALMPGKPAQVLAKIVDGKVAKWLKEVGSDSLPP